MKQTIDVETGMTVYGGNGQIIGTVTEIAGVRPDRAHHPSHSTDTLVTQAKPGTGYVRVERPGKDDLTIPFHGIDEVISARGVTLTAAMLDELRGGVVDMFSRQAEVTAQPKWQARPLKPRRHWRLTLLRRWRVWRSRIWLLSRQSEVRATVLADGAGRKS